MIVAVIVIAGAVLVIALVVDVDIAAADPADAVAASLMVLLPPKKIFS